MTMTKTRVTVTAAAWAGHLIPSVPGPGLSPLVMSPHSGSHHHLIWQVGRLRLTEFTNSKSGKLTDFGVLSLRHPIKLPRPLKEETETPGGTWQGRRD